MEQVATANIDGAAAVRLAGTDSGWATTTVLKNGDTVTVLTYPAADDGDGCIAAPPSIDARADEARLKATSPGWHRIRTQAAPGGGILVTATYEGARLRPPAAVPGETNTWRFWLDPENEPETTVAARDLSRYFILGWTEEGTLARELEERRGTDDPYPELSRAAQPLWFSSFPRQWRCPTSRARGGWARH